jgi:hypothetical protein
MRRRKAPQGRLTSLDFDAKAQPLGYGWLLDGWPVERIFARARELSTDSLQSAIERGMMLLYLRSERKLLLKNADYDKYHIGISRRDGHKFMKLATHPRMDRTTGRNQEIGTPVISC